jgi:predicted protein tyrosine phosphatase
MLKSVSFMSLAAVGLVPAEKSIAVVSIRDSASIDRLPSFEGFWETLPVHMLDACEEHFALPSGSWPDEPTPQQHLQYCESAVDSAPSTSHAREIQEFLLRAHGSVTPLDVVVHCSAGASRSAAVAIWISEKFGVPLRDVLNKGLDDANPRLLRLLRALP